MLTEHCLQELLPWSLTCEMSSPEVLRSVLPWPWSKDIKVSSFACFNPIHTLTAFIADAVFRWDPCWGLVYSCYIFVSHVWQSFVSAD